MALDEVVHKARRDTSGFVQLVTSLRASNGYIRLQLRVYMYNA